MTERPVSWATLGLGPGLRLPCPNALPCSMLRELPAGYHACVGYATGHHFSVLSSPQIILGTLSLLSLSLLYPQCLAGDGSF